VREMILNHASLSVPDRHTAIVWLKGVAVGMAQLVRSKCAKKSLRMSIPVQEIHCLPNYSLYNAMVEMRQAGGLEESRFLLSLATKVPLLGELGPDIVGRFLVCEAQELPPGEGEPLVLCAHTDSVAIGFPSHPDWDRDQITINFDELLPDESFENASETIDNLTRAVHADPICERHRARFHRGSNPLILWRNREVAFPNLILGPDVEHHLAELPSTLFQTVVGRLVDLDRSAALWRDRGGAAPPWTCKVTPESNSVRQKKRLREARRFSSHLGTRELFEWHARFGNRGRIHLRFDPHSKEVEIGYIGSHLPL